MPAAIGFIFHAPLYLLVRSFTLPRTKDNDHYDSVMTALLLVLYPFYLILLSVIASFVFHSAIPFIIIIIAPFCAWSFVQLHSQLSSR